MLSVVREFVELTKGLRPKGAELAYVKSLMVELRKLGFSSGEISDLSGGMYDGATVRDYTTGWDGVTDPGERSNAMKTLRRLIASGRTLDEVDNFVAIDRALKARGSSIGKVADESVKAMERGDSIEGLSRLNEELDSNRTSVLPLLKMINVENRYIGLGYPAIYREHMLNGIVKYGGYDNLTKGMDLYKSIEDLDKRIVDKKVEVIVEEVNRDEAIRQRNEAERQRDVFNGQVNAVQALYGTGWEPLSLVMAPDVLKKFSSMKEASESLKLINSAEEAEKKSKERIQETENAIKEKDKELDRVNSEIASAKESFEKQFSHVALKKKSLAHLLNYLGRADEVDEFINFLLDPNEIQLNGNTVVGTLDMLLRVFMDKLEKEDIPTEFIDLVREHVPPLRDGFKQFKYLKQPQA